MGIFLSCILGARENGKGRKNGCWGRYLLVPPQAFFNSIPSPHRSELRDELMWCLPSSSSAILLPNWGREEKVASGDGGVDGEKEKEAEEKGPGGGINLRPPSAAHTTQASRGGGRRRRVGRRRRFSEAASGRGKKRKISSLLLSLLLLFTWLKMFLPPLLVSFPTICSRVPLLTNGKTKPLPNLIVAPSISLRFSFSDESPFVTGRI